MEKGSSLRREAAGQILRAYRFERSQMYGYNPYDTNVIYDRDIHDYVRMMNGLTATFDYAVRLPGSNIVLDLGTGNGKGCSQLARQYKNLNFIGTGLCRHPETDIFLPGDKFKIASGESLKGLRNNSIACVIANFSITYSHAQQLVAERINEVLVPGGITKATFLPNFEGQHHLFYGQEKEILDNTNPRDHQEFEKQLRAMGYDIVVQPIFYPDGASIGRNILLAIKPGNPTSLSARDVLDADYKQMNIGGRFKNWFKRYF